MTSKILDIIGRQVVYRASHPNAESEQGQVTSVNDRFVFVRFSATGSTSPACDPSDLSFLDGSPVKIQHAKRG